MPARTPALERQVLAKARTVFRKHSGVTGLAATMPNGLHLATLYAGSASCCRERVRPGVTPLLANPDLAAVARRVPRGVICLISALAVHDLTTQIPHEFYLAVPRHSEPPRVDYPPIRVFRFGGRAFAAGVETKDMDGTPVRV